MKGKCCSCRSRSDLIVEHRDRFRKMIPEGSIKRPIVKSSANQR